MSENIKGTCTSQYGYTLLGIVFSQYQSQTNLKTMECCCLTSKIKKIFSSGTDAPLLFCNEHVPEILLPNKFLQMISNFNTLRNVQGISYKLKNHSVQWIVTISVSIDILSIHWVCEKWNTPIVQYYATHKIDIFKVRSQNTCYVWWIRVNRAEGKTQEAWLWISPRCLCAHIN